MPLALQPPPHSRVPRQQEPRAGVGRGAIENIDFRRGESGEGRIIVTLSDPSIVVDTVEQGGRIIVKFLNAELPERLQRRLDVLDFATPVRLVDTVQAGRNVQMDDQCEGRLRTSGVSVG